MYRVRSGTSGMNVSSSRRRQSLWFGTVGMFEREGFTEVAPMGASRLMRKVVR